MRLPFDQSQRLKLIDDAAKGDRLKIQKLCQSALVDTLILSQICQHLPLRPGQAGSPRVLLKSLFKKPSDVMQQESQRGRIRFHKQIFIRLLMISLSSY